jgi:hypothetical protein
MPNVGYLLLGMLFGFMVGTIVTSYLTGAFVSNDWLWPFRKE